MKARSVNENQFKRNKNPHDSLNIGEYDIDTIIKKVYTSFEEIGYPISSNHTDDGYIDFHIPFGNHNFMVSYNIDTKKWWFDGYQNELTLSMDIFEKIIKHFITKYIGRPNQLNDYIDKHQNELDKFTKKKQGLIDNLNKMKELLNES